MRFKKYLKEGGGKFSYASPLAGENAKTLESLIRSNNGVFKSTKQRWYLLNKQFDRNDKYGTKVDKQKASSLQKHMGVKVKEGNFWVEVDAFLVFGKRGAGQGTRFIEWGYEIDDVGVVKKYKFKFIYRKDGSGTEGIDKSKTTVEWERNEGDPKIKEFQEVIGQEKVARLKKELTNKRELKGSDYIGVIGERVKGVPIEVLRKHSFETRFGWSSITVLKDDEGNMIQHFGTNRLSKGDKKKIDFTVKGHEVAEINKWNKVAYKYTSVSRIAISKES